MPENEKTLPIPGHSAFVMINKKAMVMATENLKGLMGKRETLAFLSEIRRALEKE